LKSIASVDKRPGRWRRRGLTGGPPFDPNRLDGKCIDGLDPPKSNGAYPLDRPPYFAYPVMVAIVFTCGGTKTDGDARMVSATGD
jgi:tricarballylate dehydrogenase